MDPPKAAFLFSNSLLLFVFLKFGLSFANDFISVDQSLSGNQTITSRSGNFVLGFFQPGNNNSVQKFYVGIWYKNDPQLTPVWVANRETPVTDITTTELKISNDGNLVLLNQFKTHIWSSNAAGVSSNLTVAVILDTGNLVLRDRSDMSKVFWQSCDHPADTWLPGCYLGLNKVTGDNRRLTSWKNIYDPSPGLFSLVVESSQFLLRRNNSMQYWTSGTYNNQTFSIASELSSDQSEHFEYISNTTVNYSTYFQKDDEIVRIIMDRHGQLQKLVWHANSTYWTPLWSVPENQCDVYAVCGPFGYCMETDSSLCNCPHGFIALSSWDWFLGDYSSGCIRNEQQHCSTSDEFFKMPGMSAHEYPHSVLADSAKDCELACLNNCSCTAYSYGNSCSAWFTDFLTLQFSYGYNGDILALRVGATARMLKESNRVHIRVYLDVLGGILGFISCLAVIFLIIRRCIRRDKMLKMNLVEGNLIPFRYSDLRQITKNFSERLGGGSFGSVYKGMLPNSTVVAVKKLESILQGDKQFRSEVSTIGVIQHVNLVRLHGFCSEGNKRLLVYEYMPNASLDCHLFQNSSIVLDWKMRLQIALGTARGLAYLHEGCRDCIIHCDIKPENILLDASFVPKVADFGLAKNVDRNFKRVLTTMRGTVGYLAPEWIFGGSITAKADVYSYGMMLLEIISGRRNSDGLDEGHYFPLWAANKVVEGDILSLLDPRLDGNANLEELGRACKVACWCIQDNELWRLSMGQVVQILEGIVEVNMPPIPKMLQTFADNIKSNCSSDDKAAHK